MNTWGKSIIRPIFGLVAIQPVVLLWLWFNSENMWEQYVQTGWGLQGVITIYLIPIYHYYDVIYQKLSNSSE